MSLRIPGNIHYGPSETQQQYENVLINGCFRVWQRGETITSATDFPNTDDRYCADRWCLLSDGNNRVDVSREQTIVPDGFESAFKFDVEVVTAAPNSEKFGILQVIEAQNCAHLFDGGNGTVNLSFYARTTGGVVENIRAVVLAWDGAADTVTSDVVAVWAVEGTNPTWAANWTEENTPTDLALTNAYQRFTIENIALDTANTTNIGVFIWADDTDLVATDVLYIAGVQLERAYAGRGVSDFVHRHIGDELFLSQRYFSKTFSCGTTPAQNAGLLGAVYNNTTYVSAGPVVASLALHWQYPVEMRAVPTTVTYNPSDTNANAENVVTSDNEVVTEEGKGSSSVSWYDTDVGTTVGQRHAIHATAEAEL